MAHHAFNPRAVLNPCRSILLLVMASAIAGCSSHGTASASGKSDASLGGAPSGGAGSDASQGGSGGAWDAAAESDAGPSCLDPKKLLPLGALGVTGGCSQSTSCGGSLEGTWTIDSVCADISKLVPGFQKICPYLEGDSASATATGYIVFSNGRVTRHMVVDGTVRFRTTNSGCAYGNTGNVACSARLGPTCSSSPPGCACSSPVHIDVDDVAAYTTSSSSFSVAGDAGAYDYCVDATGLTLVDPELGTLHLKRSATLPEVCDGLDQNGNQVADESPVDCPACSTLGVCAVGSAPVCVAGAWSCNYASSKYEKVEATCDGLDNDCNGIIDDPAECHEPCNGLDDNGDGTIDNLLTPPQCSKAGVCASGGSPQCMGTAGWKCNYTSPQYEPVEKSCDGLDNDCNGEIDENCATCPGTLAGQLYVLDMPDVQSQNLDGSGLTTLFRPSTDTGASLNGIAVDVTEKQLYWTDASGNAALYRATFDGSQIEKLATWTSNWSNAGDEVALDLADRYVYWTDQGNGGVIRRMSLAAFALPEVVHTGFNSAVLASCLALDLSARKVYWCNSDVWRADLDGANAESVMVAPSGQLASSVAVDPANGNLYVAWSSTIERAKLDGSSRQTLASANYPQYLHVDAAAGYLYWRQDSTMRLSLAADAGVPVTIGYNAEGLTITRCVAP